MAGIGALLCLLVLCLSVSSLEMTGPSVHAARLGFDARVSCLFAVDNPPVDPEHLMIFWFFQDKEILIYNNTVRKTSSRYSLSTEALETGIADLTISNLQIPDGGMYKCSVTYRSEMKAKEVRLDIGAPPQVKIIGHTVFMNKESVLSCFISEFYPVDIDIRWFKDGKRLNNISVGNPWRNNDKTYSVNSSVTITPTEEDRYLIFSCSVQHDFLQEPLHENFQLVYTDGPSTGIIAACCVIVSILIILIAVGLWWKLHPRRKAAGPFIVRDIEAPPKLVDGEEASLYCTVDNSPEDLYVIWLMRRAGQEQEIHRSQMRGHPGEEVKSLLDTSYVIRSQLEGRQYSTSLRFEPHIERHRDVTFICRGVSDPHTDEKKFHCKIIYVKPRLSQPVMRSLMDSGEMKYLLTVENFFPKNIKIIWKCGEGRTKVLSSTESPSDNPDRTYNVSSEVTIPEEHHKDPGFRVRVTWEHESMDKTESRELSMRDSVYRWKPEMEQIQIPPLLHGSPATLQCNVSGYFPDAVTVTWKRFPHLELHEETQIIKHGKTTDNSYICTAKLTIFTTRGEHHGAEYICLVEHPSLEEPIGRRTVRLQVYANEKSSE